MGTGIILAMSLITQANGATCDRNYAASLNRAVDSTLSAVANGNSGALLNMISREGVSIGSDGEFLPYEEVSAQFKARTGRYCDLFTCGGRAGPLKRLFVRGKIDTQLDTRNLLGTVFINANTNDELQLSYKYTTQCKWEITGIGAL